VTTRKEANALVTGSGLVLSIKEVLRNAVQGTYRRNTDNAEISARLSTARMFKGVPVKRRRQYAILEEIREKELMTYERYDGKITYSLNFNPLRITKLDTKPLSAIELGIAVRKQVTIAIVRSWAARA
jgi:hypothetical protein